MSHKADSLVEPAAASAVAPVETPRPDAVTAAAQTKTEQGGAVAPAMPTEPERATRVQQPLQDEKSHMQSSRRVNVVYEDRKTSVMTASRRRMFDGAIFAVFVLNVLAVAWLLIRAWDSEDVYVTIPGMGDVRGIQATVENQPVYVFRGIQYARSPEGLLRFAPDFTVQWPVVNAQLIRSNEDTTEDCLHLNVWTPCTERTAPGCRKTVLVFFHAIEFQNGDNNYYDGLWLTGLGHLVVVAPNFRLGGIRISQHR
ncbi:hypothetical protein MRX96_045325 [Rhipicephalus microplus]